MSETNWAGNITFRAARRHEPASVAELQAIVAGSERVHVVGAGHSFSTVADTDGDLVSLASLPARVDVDESARRVVVSGGLRYAELGPALHARGWALANLASVPHVTVAGAVATGTHGSGDRNPSLAATVTAVELVTSDGTVHTLRRGDDADFPGAVVALGALGAVTALELEVEPAYDVRQLVTDDVPYDALRADPESVLRSAYAVSAFTDLRAPLLFQVWRKQRDGEPDPPRDWLGGRAADGPRHPIAGIDPAACTTQLGVPGPWHERLPHFRADAVPSVGAELQSEWLVDRADLGPALDAFTSVADRMVDLIQVVEVRSMAADDLWLSPAQGRDTVGFHVTWRLDPAAVARAVARVDEVLEPFDPRPHWGKVSGRSWPAVLASYPHARDFARLRSRLDPRGAFGNAYTDTVLAALAAERAG